MQDRIRAGAMLVEDGTNFPEFMTVATEPFADGWSCVKGYTGAQLGREIDKAGWTFFFMAGEIHGNGFGSSDASRTERAVAKLIAAVKLQQCNCLEITQLRQRSLFGFPYISLLAHARHIQQSRSFFDLSKKTVKAPAPPPDWLYELAAPASALVAPITEAPKGA